MKQRVSGFKLEPVSIEQSLVGYADSGKMFRMYLPRKNKVDTVPQVTCHPSSYSTRDVHTPPIPSNLADTSPPIIQQLRSQTLQPRTQTITSFLQQTLPGSYLEVPVLCQHPTLIEVQAPATHIEDYLEVADNEFESQRDSVPTNPIADPSTPPRNPATSMPSAHKSY